MDSEGNEIKEEKITQPTEETPAESNPSPNDMPEADLPIVPEDEEAIMEPPPGLLPHQVGLPSDASAGLTTYTPSLAPSQTLPRDEAEKRPGSEHTEDRWENIPPMKKSRL